ncbi:Hypothetical_protein [Hexamita inflata]|uniref:Hypothetical_protein n=1 Tax=Hexamita inflata TaxID=28002 RepID=A0AA86QUR0_9EUKA|nr:Hypothetical protein HINF_LOCUS48757 [Hexamita inflata]
MIEKNAQPHKLARSPGRLPNSIQQRENTLNSPSQLKQSLKNQLLKANYELSTIQEKLKITKIPPISSTRTKQPKLLVKSYREKMEVQNTFLQFGKTPMQIAYDDLLSELKQMDLTDKEIAKKVIVKEKILIETHLEEQTNHAHDMKELAEQRCKIKLEQMVQVQPMLYSKQKAIAFTHVHQDQKHRISCTQAINGLAISASIDQDYQMQKINNIQSDIEQDLVHQDPQPQLIKQDSAININTNNSSTTHAVSKNGSVVKDQDLLMAPSSKSPSTKKITQDKTLVDQKLNNDTTESQKHIPPKINNPEPVPPTPDQNKQNEPVTDQNEINNEIKTENPQPIKKKKAKKAVPNPETVNAPISPFDPPKEIIQ